MTRVVVAEDDESMRTLLVEALREDGFEVVEAENGRELFWAVENASSPVEIVVSDLRMPAYNGLDIVQAWAELGGGPRVVLMSAFPDPEIRLRAERLGVPLLEKPFELWELRSLVQSAAQALARRAPQQKS
ncbi:MAG: response regulator [Polyangiaceae bacterium]